VRGNLHATGRAQQAQVVLGAALAALLVTAGCSHKVSAGHVNGNLRGVAIGSSVALPPQPLSGEIVLTDDTGKATKVRREQMARTPSPCRRAATRGPSTA